MTEGFVHSASSSVKERGGGRDFSDQAQPAGTREINPFFPSKFSRTTCPFLCCRETERKQETKKDRHELDKDEQSAEGGGWGDVDALLLLLLVLECGGLVAP